MQHLSCVPELSLIKQIISLHEQTVNLLCCFITLAFLYTKGHQPHPLAATTVTLTLVIVLDCRRSSAQMFSFVPLVPLELIFQELMACL